MVRTLALVLACSLVLATSARADDSYPRFAGVLIGSPHDYWTATYQDRIAKLNVALLGAYPGWGSGQRTTMETVIRQIKAKNPQTKIFLYTMAESQVIPISSAWPGLQAKIDQQRWWLYNPYGSTAKVLADTGVNNYVLNITPYSSKDANGQRFNQWYANYMVDQLIKPTPSADGLFADGVFWRPRRDGDWNQDGKTDSAKDPVVGSWLRQGHAQYVDTLRARMPGKLQIANAADWGQPNAVITEYQGKWNGGVMEGLIGKSYSIEGYGGWAAMMAQYRKTMAAFAAPKLGIFQMSGSLTDYQGYRYGLTSCLMDGGYFAFNDTAKAYYGVPLFDEQNVDLGAATSPPPTAAWSNGVYRRDFANGIALVNPKGNGPRSVTLETDFRRIQGTQVPGINSGQTVRTLTLNDRDGIILLRAGQKPEAPQLTVQ